MQMIGDLLQYLQLRWIPLLLVIVSSYILGSVSFAIIVTKQFDKKDIRSEGSGNAGTTNVLRTVGKTAGALTMLGDVVKGMAAVGLGIFIFRIFNDSSYSLDADVCIGSYVASLFVILGHMFPVFFQFKGGKGVATALGVMLISDIRVCAAVLITFIIVSIISKRVSAGSVCGAIMYAVSNFVFVYFCDYHTEENIMSGYTQFTALRFIVVMVLSVMISSAVVIKHKSNIARIFNGTEPKFSIKKEGKS